MKLCSSLFSLIVCALAAAAAAQDTGFDRAEPEARIRALHAAAALEDPADAPRFAAMLADPVVDVRRAAIEALIAVRPDLADLAATLRDLATNPELEEEFMILSHPRFPMDPGDAVEDPDPEVRARALEELAFARPKDEAAKKTVIKAASDAAAIVRAAAAQALGRMSWSQLSLEAVEQLLKDAESSVRKAAALAMARPDPACVLRLRSAVQDPVVSVRMAVARSLGDCGAAGAAAAPDLAGMLRDPATGVRHAAIEAAGKLGLHGPRILDVVRATLASVQSSEQAVALNYATAIGPGAVSLLPRALELSRSEWRHVRRYAIEAVWAVATPTERGVAALRLVEVVADPHPQVSDYAKIVLRRWMQDT